MPPWGQPVAFNLPRQNIVSFSFQSIQAEPTRRNTMKKGKRHMDISMRSRIEFALAAGHSTRTIARDIGVSLSTVSREIRKHTYESFKGCYGRTNQCIHRADCRLSGVCKDCPGNGVPCRRCSYRNCNKHCEKVQYIDCAQRTKRTEIGRAHV